MGWGGVCACGARPGMSARESPLPLVHSVYPERGEALVEALRGHWARTCRHAHLPRALSMNALLVMIHGVMCLVLAMMLPSVRLPKLRVGRRPASKALGRWVSRYIIHKLVLVENTSKDLLNLGF